MDDTDIMQLKAKIESIESNINSPAGEPLSPTIVNLVRSNEHLAPVQEQFKITLPLSTLNPPKARRSTRKLRPVPSQRSHRSRQSNQGSIESHQPSQIIREIVPAEIDKDEVKGLVQEEMGKVTELLAVSARRMDEGNERVQEAQYKLDETIVRLEEYTDKKTTELEVALKEQLQKAQEAMQSDVSQTKHEMTKEVDAL